MGQGHAKEKLLSKSELRSYKRNVSFSEDEIVDWYTDFCSRSTTNAGDPNRPYLSEKEFVKVYNSVYTTGNGEQFAKHVFRTFDLDRDGKLNFREFLVGMSMSGSSDPKKLLTWAFQLYDVKNTGYIVKAEMTEIIRSVFRLLGSEVLCHNGDDYTPEFLAHEIFNQLDKNGDQKISYQEFCEGASTNPMVVKLLQCEPSSYAEDVNKDENDVFS